jgi:hypothetical protein
LILAVAIDFLEQRVHPRLGPSARQMRMIGILRG